MIKVPTMNKNLKCKKILCQFCNTYFKSVQTDVDVNFSAIILVKFKEWHNKINTIG